MKEASSEHKKAMTPPISSGCPTLKGKWNVLVDSLFGVNIQVKNDLYRLMQSCFLNSSMMSSFSHNWVDKNDSWDVTEHNTINENKSHML